MKQKFFIVLALMLLLASAVPAAAQEIKLPPQLEYIDAQVNVFLPKLEKFQDAYFEKNKGYYQILGSHSIVPNGAKDADKLRDHPTDQNGTLAPLWDDAGLPTMIAWAFSIDVYVSPKGPGYILNVCTTVGVDDWCRSIGYGPEENTRTWAVKVEEK